MSLPHTPPRGQDDKRGIERIVRSARSLGFGTPSAASTSSNARLFPGTETVPERAYKQPIANRSREESSSYGSMMPTVWGGNPRASVWNEESSPSAYLRSEKADELLEAIEKDSNDGVRSVMAKMSTAEFKIAIATASLAMERCLRTPLMAATARGDVEIFRTVFNAFVNTMFGADASETYLTIEHQLEIRDKYGMNLLILAASSGSPLVFHTVSSQIPRSKVRRYIQRGDTASMSFLMHVACTGLGSGISSTPEPLEYVESLMRSPVSATDVEARGTDSAGEGGSGSSGEVDETRDAFFVAQEAPDVWVPTVKLVFHFAKKHLYMPEYRRLLTARDVWGRSLIEHSIRSGRPQVLEAVFETMRVDVHDDTLETMMDKGDGVNDTALNRVLQSENGKRVQGMFKFIYTNLQKDVRLRAEASSVTNKIQSFIPASMIVVFQFLLPELSSESNHPLYLLLILCAIAPVWSWGGNVVARDDPENANRKPRVTMVKHVLTTPAMFFWGLGTSSIATASFGWADTASAAILGVATIVIPAMDSFFSGPAARSTHAYVRTHSV